jgi:hypothetical protein
MTAFRMIPVTSADKVAPTIVRPGRRVRKASETPVLRGRAKFASAAGFAAAARGLRRGSSARTKS